MLRRRRTWLAVAVLLGAVGLTAFLEPNQIVPGLLGGDAFYWLRPTRYWRKLLADDGANRSISKSTRDRFYSDLFRPTAVFSQCLDDPDPNVRWATIDFYVRQVGIRDAMPALLNALNDPNADVRMVVLQTLETYSRDEGPASAVPRLCQLVDDADARVAEAAERALWRIDQKEAAVACKWVRFHNEAWHFSVALPTQPKEQSGMAPGPHEPVRVQNWTSSHFGAVFAVAISEYSEQQMIDIPPERWIERLRSQTGPMGLHVIQERTIELNGLKGWELISAANSNGKIVARLFWVGRRLYQVTVTFDPEVVIPMAANYFLNSFHVEIRSAKQDRASDHGKPK